MLTRRRKNELARLVRKYLQGKASGKESRFLDRYDRYFDREERISSRLSEEEKSFLEEKILRNIYRRIPEAGSAPVIPLFKRPVFRVAAAAAVLILLSAGIYLRINQTGSHKIMAANEAHHDTDDVSPGGNRAVLTLANGSTIVLDSLQNGTIAQQGNTRVLKLNGSQLSYQTSAAGQPSPTVAYNIISTPRGGQYQVVLPDGSRVWLNAASSLRFPTVFSAKERQVELKGEAYFEIAKNADKPFTVHIPSAERGGREETVEVLGTRFNVMAYDDEASVETTLLDGAVKVTEGRKSTLLRPGQQAGIRQGAPGIGVADVDTEEVIAWKNGFFRFDDDDMAGIMREIARWYDVEVNYENGIPAGHYTGVVSRNNDLSQVLKMLELSGVQFKIAGRKIMVIQ